jgi:hypothetical protein
VTALNWTSGHPERQLPSAFPSRPQPAPDGLRVAGIAGSWLWLGTWGGPIRAIQLGREQGQRSCLSPLWSDDSSRLLLRCGDELRVWTMSGRLMVSRAVSSVGRLAWAPHSHEAVLFSRGHDLRLWSVDTNRRRILILTAQLVHG